MNQSLMKLIDVKQSIILATLVVSGFVFKSIGILNSTFMHGHREEEYSWVKVL